MGFHKHISERKLETISKQLEDQMSSCVITCWLKTKQLKQKKVAPVTDAEKVYLRKLVFVGVLNIYPSPYFTHFFPNFTNSFLTSFENDAPIPLREEITPPKSFPAWFLF